MERTFALLKPDAVRRGLVGEIIARFEKSSLAIQLLKMIYPTREMVEACVLGTPERLCVIGEKTFKNHNDAGSDPVLAFGTKVPEEIGRIVRQRSIDYLSSGPVVAIVLHGEGAIAKVRRLVGHTFPNLASPGTIRGDYSSVSGVECDLRGVSCPNLVHASSDEEEVERDIASWFFEEKGI